MYVLDMVGGVKRSARGRFFCSGRLGTVTPMLADIRYAPGLDLSF